MFCLRLRHLTTWEVKHLLTAVTLHQTVYNSCSSVLWTAKTQVLFTSKMYWYSAPHFCSSDSDLMINFSSVLWHSWLGDGKGTWQLKNRCHLSATCNHPEQMNVEKQRVSNMAVKMVLQERFEQGIVLAMARHHGVMLPLGYMLLPCCISTDGWMVSSIPISTAGGISFSSERVKAVE